MGCKGCGFNAIVNAYTALLMDENNALAVERIDLCNVCEFNRNGFCMKCPSMVKCWVKAKVRGKEQICPVGKW